MGTFACPRERSARRRPGVNPMKRLISNLFGTPSAPKSLKVANRVRPAFEALEDRQLMAASLVGGSLVVAGTAANDSVAVNNYHSLLGDFYKVTTNGVNQYFRTSQVTTGAVYFYGYAGNDYFANNSASLRVVAYGGTGNDSLIGNAKNDYLFGEDGNDYLYGGAGNDYLYGGNGDDRMYGADGVDVLCGGYGNDKLYGGNGYDYLYGEDGNDFMDAGSKYEYYNGGNGYDFNAYVTAIGGATYTDVRQGYAGTCGLVSAISSVAHTGIDLSARITYQGNNIYSVGLYKTNSILGIKYQYYTSVSVYFNGDTYGADAICNPAQEGESWVLLTQRAYLQSRGLSLTSPPGMWPYDTLTGLTGRFSATTWAGSSGMPGSSLTTITNALAVNHNVVAWTPNSTTNLSTMLVANHAYTVLRVETQWVNVGFFHIPTYYVVVRNPWGYDGGATASGNASDGEIRLSWYDFSRSMSGLATN
jgi:hypothetical protein